MIPSIGRIVHYQLSEHDAERIMGRRETLGGSVDGLGLAGLVEIGNPVRAGGVYPLVITRVWGETEESAVNGQVLLDGNDTLWVTSRKQGGDLGQWSDPREA